MKPAAAALSALALLFACNGDPPDQTGTATATATDTTDATTTTDTAGSATATATTTTTTTTTDGTATGESTTDQDGCRLIDCAPGFTCVDGVCEPTPDTCSSPQLSSGLERPAILLVADKSGSMLTLWDSDDDPNTPAITRWRSLYNVLESLINIIANFHPPGVALGLQLYPSNQATAALDASACLVEDVPEAPVGPMNEIGVLIALPAPDTEVAGGTPARKVLTSAITHLKQLPGEGPKLIIFITDGAANCSPEAENPLNVNKLFETYDPQVIDLVGQSGVGVIVVGIDIKDEFSPKAPDGEPDSINTFEELAALAVAGGHPSPGGFPFFYNATDENELLELLTQLVSPFNGCQFALDPVPGPDDAVQVLVNDMAVLQQATCDGAGWIFAKQDRSEIRLCGDACAAFQRGADLTVEYNCPAKETPTPPVLERPIGR
ncbi:MAG: VWA domain-containing protein [Nannocystis sp.]|nr:VWA domain-containing protein [Nannocystis sp.]